MKTLLFAFVWLFTLAIAGAQEQSISSGVRFEPIGTYDVARLNQVLTEEIKEFSSFSITYPEAKYPVKLFRIIYPSVIPEQRNQPTMASGLLAVPDMKGDTFPVVSYQHGTVFTKTAVPSHPDESMETRLMLANFASQGYIVIAADYFGKGLSTETDSYLVKASTQQACLDNLKAAQAVSAHLKLNWGPLFVSGWSQGGWATGNFLRKLEQVGIEVTAAGIASGPSDIYAIINGWMYAPREIDASYIPAIFALQLHSFQNYYNIPGLAAAALKPEYLETARDLYLNKITYEEAAPKLPSKAIDIFNEDFLVGGPQSLTPYWQLLQSAENYRWRSKTPLRAYYGAADEVTTRAIASLPVEYRKMIGATEGTAVDSGDDATHRGVFLFGMKDQQEWFASLLEKK